MVGMGEVARLMLVVYATSHAWKHQLTHAVYGKLELVSGQVGVPRQPPHPLCQYMFLPACVESRMMEEIIVFNRGNHSILWGITVFYRES